MLNLHHIYFNIIKGATGTSGNQGATYTVFGKASGWTTPIQLSTFFSSPATPGFV